jgi:hypothetical protein
VGGGDGGLLGPNFQIEMLRGLLINVISTYGVVLNRGGALGMRPTRNAVRWESGEAEQVDAHDAA